MPKATLKLPTGTVVTLEGTPDEVHRLLALYSGEGQHSVPAPADKPRRARHHAPKTKHDSNESKESDVNEIVNLVKSCDEAEAL